MADRGSAIFCAYVFLYFDFYRVLEKVFSFAFFLYIYIYINCANVENCESFRDFGYIYIYIYIYRLIFI